MESMLYIVPMLIRADEKGFNVENRIRALRAEHEWSQGNLAARLEVSRQTVNAIENGRYDPSLPLAFKIARVFGRPIEEIFCDKHTDDETEHEEIRNA